MRVTPEGRHGCADEGGRIHYQRIAREPAGRHARRDAPRERGALLVSVRKLSAG